jgi:hypothetical protein
VKSGIIVVSTLISASNFLFKMVRHKHREILIPSFLTTCGQGIINIFQPEFMLMSGGDESEWGDLALYPLPMMPKCSIFLNSKV